MPSPRSAANPASHPSLPRRASPPDCSLVAVSRLVTGLSRASCRDASGLAVLMSTGRRAGRPGLSRPGVPAPRWPGSCASPAPAVRSISSPTVSCSGGLPDIANTGGWASQGTSHARGNGRPPGRWARVAHRTWSDALACSRGRGQRARVGFRLCSCGEAAKAAWALDAPGLPEAARCGCLPVTSTPCPAGHGCITGARPSCSRQRPGECAAAGGLYAS
jgi:hypothetical protein